MTLTERINSERFKVKIREVAGNSFFKKIFSSFIGESFFWNIIASCAAVAVGALSIVSSIAILTTPLGWSAAIFASISGGFWLASNTTFARKHIGEKTCNRIAAASSFAAVVCAGIVTSIPALATISTAIGAISCYAWYSDSHFADKIAASTSSLTLAAIAGITGGASALFYAAFISGVAWVGTSVAKPEENKKYDGDYIPTIWRKPFEYIESVKISISNFKSHMVGGVIINPRDKQVNIDYPSVYDIPTDRAPIPYCRGYESNHWAILAKGKGTEEKDTNDKTSEPLSMYSNQRF